MFIGSCFANEIGQKMAEGKMNVMINPSGTVYNPISVMNTIMLLIDGNHLSEKDLFFHNGHYLSFMHYTSFNSPDKKIILGRINDSIDSGHEFLKKAEYLFISFGTASIYRHTESATLVSNCHKMPDSLFSKELLPVDKIVSEWTRLLDTLSGFNKTLRVVFTVSPVRHWKDGAHGNQLSKSTLFLAVEQLLNHPSVEAYFPAYEMLIDDLRDYRFYAGDMLHPSQTAIEYIWENFTSAFFEQADLQTWSETEAITKAMKHRFISDSAKARKDFAGVMLAKIEALNSKNPDLDLASEKSYFLLILNEE
jgi:hypothetical protein